jgi:hypothetical protein
MKQTIVTFAVLTLAIIGLNAAQTNPVSTNDATTTPKLNTNSLSMKDDATPKESYELTIGGGGFVNPTTSQTQFGLDTTFSTDPIKKYPNVWFGVEQVLSWQPSVAGETDIYPEYAWDIYKDLWLNTGWYAGLSYDSDTSAWHTGPEASFEYYVGANAFIYIGASYDVLSRGVDNSQIPYRFGIGITF